VANVNSNFDPAFGVLAEKLRTQAAAQGIKTHYISGVRSLEDQRQLYANYQAGKAGQPLPYPARGPVPLAAVPGSSMHERGLAADIEADDPNQQAKLRALGNQIGLRTIGPSDPNHFEMAKANIPKGGGAPGAIAFADNPAASLAAATPRSAAASQVAGPGAPSTSGTTINAASTPIAGALADQGPESVGASGPAAASSGPLDTRQLVFNKLTAAGLQPHQALGALWSLAGESGKGLDPGAYNPKDPGGSVGIGQWLGPRRAALEAFAKDRGTAVTDPNTQADFLVDELTNEKAATYQPGVFKAMQGAQTAADATKVWTSQFERPEKDNSDARIKGGTNVASLDSNGQFVLGPGGGSTAAPATGTAVAAAAPTTPESWWGKLFDKPTDGGANAQSPFQQATNAFLNAPQKEQAAERAQAPQDGTPASEQAAQQRFAPGARNVSLGLASVPQTYGTTINAASRPLTWTDAPPGPPKTPAAGLQGAMYAQIPGTSINSVQPPPQGLGYGVDPNIGYGYG
jgi:Phage tail lysozyme/D-alanyl-D-alanine carboxypeptidase